MRVICTKTDRGCSTLLIWGRAVDMECSGCLYYTRISEPIEVEDWPGDEDHLLAALARDKAVVDYASHVVWQFGTLLDGFAYLASRFEEVCGERADLQEAFFHDAEVFCLPCPGDPEDYTFVRAHYRPKPRRSESVKTEATPTGDKDGESGASPARSGEATRPFRDGVTLWYCERCDQVVEHYPCKWCGFEGQPPGYKCGTCFGLGLPSMPCPDCGADTIHPGLAVCRWEVGRWA